MTSVDVLILLLIGMYIINKVIGVILDHLLGKGDES